MAVVVVRVRIEGRVQGVWFRAWTRDQARARDLDGWVRNRRDGTVEALFAGSADRVEEMVAACHRGSRAARVTAVHRHPAGDEDLRGEGFHQLATE